MLDKELEIEFEAYQNIKKFVNRDSLLFKVTKIENGYELKNKDELSKGVKFKRDISNFKTNYWQNEAISSVFEFLSSKFKENFKQSKNVN